MLGDRRRAARRPPGGRPVPVPEQCGGGAPPAAPPAAAPSPTPSCAPARPPTLIPQPVPPDYLPFPLAPDNERVDLQRPKFSRPLDITNPLFPINAQASVLHLGNVEGAPLRTEVTNLPYTRVVDWDGELIETRVSQYVAYVGGRIKEVAIDLYAQADDGAVWYFGEDVFRYADGVIIDTDGTWAAGRDGPAQLIMPGHPAVGQVFRAENIPGLAFEEVRITAVDQTFDGPRGPIPGGVVARELNVDGYSDKLFAPGYGEFRTGSATELETMALVVPTDAVAAPVPAPLGELTIRAGQLFDAAQAKDWAAAGQQLDAARAAWAAIRGGDVPAQIRDAVDEGLAGLGTAVAGARSTEAGRGAVELLRFGVDLQLRHRPVAEVELNRMHAWACQLQLDSSGADLSGAHGDIAALKLIRERLLRAVDRQLITRFDVTISAMAEAAEAEDFAALSTQAQTLREVLRAAGG